MRRSKRGPALFDLLAEDKGKGKGTQTAKVPEWWSSGDRPDKAIADAPTSAAAESRPVPAPVASDAAPGVNTRLIELDGERVRVSLTSFTTAVVVFAGLVVAFGAFELGRWRGERAGLARGHAAGRASYAADATSEIEAARNQPPATNLVDGLLTESPGNASAVEPASGEADADSKGPHWIRGYTYIVAQEFSVGYEDDARRAQEFLAGHGVATELVRLSNGATQLITTQGYNRRDPTQHQMADQLLEKTRTLGAQYYAAGGGYKLEGYFKSLKSDTW